MSDSGEYLTVEAAADWLQLTPRTIKRWMNHRLLAVYRRNVDGRLVMHVKDLARVERAQRQANAARNRAGRPRDVRVDAGS